MLPLYDLERLRRVPYVTYGLLALNMLVFLGQLTYSPVGLAQFFRQYGAVPFEITQDASQWVTILSSLFVHGNWFHLASNMLFLFIFADDLEDWLGRWQFGLFYLTCGVLATLAQVLFSPNSTVPIIGASGAIAGVLGAYYILFPDTPIRCLSFRYFYTQSLESIAAVWILLVWLVLQVINALLEINNVGNGGIAFFAHLGGFAAGVGLINVYLRYFKRGVARPMRSSGTPFNIPFRRASTPPVTDQPIRRYRADDEPGTARSPATPRYDWAAADAETAKDFEAMEAQLRDLRDKVVNLPPKREILKPVKLDLSGLGALEQRAQAMKYLNTQRGETVHVETKENGYYRGTVVSLSSKQVMLRDENGKSSWIPLQDIVRVY